MVLPGIIRLESGNRYVGGSNSAGAKTGMETFAALSAEDGLEMAGGVFFLERGHVLTLPCEIRFSRTFWLFSPVKMRLPRPSEGGRKDPSRQA